MKKILITGAGSYIGTAFANFIARWPGQYHADTLDLIDGSWQEKSFAGYDCVFHVAGIAHQKESRDNAPLYYQVNRDLAVQVAAKAKTDGVSQMIFMSSMSVYGMDEGVITPETQPRPQSHYGKSKLEAEQALACLEEEGFRVAILRPPMVYGKDCKGNFQTMRKLLSVSPVFPVLKNRRSMISAENLASFVKLVIDRECAGLFFPQNREYTNTTEMARQMADAMGRRIWFSPLAGFAVRAVKPIFGMARKAFGTLIYQDCECFDYCYCVQEPAQSFRESV